jgi:hypothetical protein
LRSTGGGSAEHGGRVERLDRQLALHVQAAIVEPDHGDIVARLVVGEGQSPPGARLAAAIGHVVGVAVEEQMLGIDATPLIATVADIHPRRNRSVPQAPGEAVRPLRMAADGERAVAAVVDRALPEVTAGNRIDLDVVGKPPLEAPARAAMHATLLHGAQTTRRVVRHLLRAMASIFRPENQASTRGPLPIKRLARERLSTVCG